MKRLRPPLTLALAAALVAGLWALARAPAPELPVPAAERELPESSYLRARHRIRDIQGKLLYEVESARLDQYPKSQVLRLDAPRLRWLNPAYENSTASARHGEIRESRVVLSGNVELLLSPPDLAPTLVRGESLTLDSARHRISSDQAVTLRQRHAVMRGVGMDYRLDGSGGALRRDVKVRQFPPARTELAETLEAPFAAARAQEASPEEPLDLSADRMEWDARRKVSVYHGNVRAERGEMILLSDRLEVHSDGERVQALRAEGNARWTSILASGKPLRANAGSILYQIPQRKATLRGNVQLRVNANQFTGEEIVYLIDEERVETPVARKPSGRVRIRLNAVPE